MTKAIVLIEVFVFYIIRIKWGLDAALSFGIVMLMLDVGDIRKRQINEK